MDRKETMETLTKEELNELDARNNLIAVHSRTAALLESEKNLFITHLLMNKGLDPEKKYEINPEDGTLSEVT